MNRGRALLSRGLLVLALLAAVGWVFFLRRQAPPSADGVGFGLPSPWQETKRFVFAGPADSIVVVREGSAFRITHPFGDSADPFFMAQVEREARELKPARVLPDTVLKDFGLDPPRNRINLVSSAGTRWELALGDSSPVGGEIYARPRGRSRILMLDRFVTRRFFLPRVDALRDRVAAPLDAGPVDSVAVLVPTRSLWARRLGKEAWLCRQPPGLSLDPLQLAQVVQLLRGPEIQGFVSGATPRSSLGLAPPRAIWVLFQGSRAESVGIGHPTENQASVYILPAGRRGPALVGSDYFRTLVDGWPGLADRHLLSVKPESISVVELEGRGRGVSYMREKGEWRKRGEGSPVKSSELFDLELRNLTLLQWRSYPVTSSVPGGGGRLRIALCTPARAETVFLAAPAGSSGWAKSSRQPRWGEVSPEAWRGWSYRLQHVQ